MLENSKTKQQQILKNEKTSFRHYFYPNRVEIGRERVKKNFVPNYVPSRPGTENSKKIAKNFNKKKKKIILAIFQSNLGRDRPTKRENNFRPKFHFNPTRVRKVQKKLQKKKKNHSSNI